jgi:hypothetical protein
LTLTELVRPQIFNMARTRPLGHPAAGRSR